MENSQDFPAIATWSMQEPTVTDAWGEGVTHCMALCFSSAGCVTSGNLISLCLGFLTRKVGSSHIGGRLACTTPSLVWKLHWKGASCGNGISQPPEAQCSRVMSSGQGTLSGSPLLQALLPFPAGWKREDFHGNLGTPVCHRRQGLVNLVPDDCTVQRCPASQLICPPPLVSQKTTSNELEPFYNLESVCYGGSPTLPDI